MEETKQIRAEIDAYYENWFRINHAYSDWALRHHTTDSIIFTLYTIATSKNGCTQQKICHELLLPKQTVSFILSKLERQNMIRRATDPDDRRNKRVFLTEEGRIYADEILAKLDEAEIRAYEGMSAGQRKALAEGYAALADAIAKSFSPKSK